MKHHTPADDPFHILQLPDPALQQVAAKLSVELGEALRGACRHGRVLANSVVKTARVRVGSQCMLLPNCLRNAVWFLPQLLGQSICRLTRCVLQVEKRFEEAFKAFPSTFPNLQGLVLGSEATDGDLVHLCHLGRLLPHLRSLKLAACAAVTDGGLRHVTQLTALTELWLVGAQLVGNDGMACLSPLTALHTLNLSGTAVADGGVARALRLPALCFLDIDRCPVTAACLIGLLDHDLSAAQEGAASAIACLSTRAQVAQTVAAGAVPRLVALLAQPSERSAAAAAVALRRLADDEPRRRAVLAAGCLPPLLPLLSHDSEHVREMAWALFKSLARGSASQRAAIVEADALPVLLAFLQSPPEAPQGAERTARLAHCTVEAIATLASGDDACCRAILSAAALAPLVARLSDGSDRYCARKAADALYELACGSDERRDAIVAAGALPPLVQMLQRLPGVFRVQVAKFLCELAKGSAARREAILAAGVLRPLDDILYGDSPYNSEWDAAEQLREALQY